MRLADTIRNTGVFFMSKDLQTLNGQNKLALWAGRISECRNSGQNVKAWCRDVNANIKVSHLTARRS